MIAFIIFKSSLVPLIQGLCSPNPWEFDFSGFRRNRTENLGINSPSLWPREPRLHVRSTYVTVVPDVYLKYFCGRCSGPNGMVSQRVIWWVPKIIGIDRVCVITTEPGRLEIGELVDCGELWTGLTVQSGWSAKTVWVNLSFAASSTKNRLRQGRVRTHNNCHGLPCIYAYAAHAHAAQTWTYRATHTDQRTHPINTKTHTQMHHSAGLALWCLRGT